MQHPPSLVGRGTSALAPDAPLLSKRSRDRSRIGSEVWLHRHQPAVPSTQAACGERSPGLDIDWQLKNSWAVSPPTADYLN